LLPKTPKPRLFINYMVAATAGFSIHFSLDQENWVELIIKDSDNFDQMLRNQIRQEFAVKNDFQIANFKGGQLVNLFYNEIKSLRGKKLVIATINPLWDGKEENADNLLKDTITLHKYKCFFKKCRKSYTNTQNLIAH